MVSHGNEPLQLMIYLFFPFSSFFFSFGMECRSQPVCLGMIWGNRTDSPCGSPICELVFTNGNVALIMMAALFNKQYLGGGLCVLDAFDCRDSSSTLVKLSVHTLTLHLIPHIIP